jgi:hypothetical protein
MKRIKRKVEAQHIDTRLPQKAKLSAIGVGVNQSGKLSLAEAARPRDT